MNETMREKNNTEFNNVNRLYFKNKLRTAVQCRNDIAVDNLIQSLDYVKREGLQPVNFDDPKSFWVFLNFWLNKYDICNLLRINIVDYKRMDFFFFQDYPSIDPVINSRYIALRKYCRCYYEKIKL
jgi:hypothetical protein